MGQLDRLEAAVGTVSGTEVPSHYLEVSPVEFLSDATTVLYRHNLVVRVDVSDVVSVPVNVWRYVGVHWVRCVAELESEASEPVLPVVGLERQGII